MADNCSATSTVEPKSSLPLEVKGVSVRFGGVAALKDVSLSIASGETVGLIGPNGAGKSTFVNCIMGVFPPSSGEIWHRGVRIDGQLPRRLASQGIARTFQNLRLMRSMTVLENVMLGCHHRMRSGMTSAVLRLPRQRREEDSTRETALALLDRFDLRPFAGRQIGSLPYAQQKATELCRALAAEPELLLLDEPAAGMSASERENTVSVIESLSGREMSILLIEHDVALVMRACPRLAVLDDGVKIADGTPEEIQKNDAVIRAYLGQD